MSRPVVVLGATGSIGTQTFQVIDSLGLECLGMAARSPSQALLDLAQRYPGAVVACSGGTHDERQDFQRRVGGRARFGQEAVLEIAATPGAVVVNGIVGAAGLKATLAALDAGNRLALANKESLVAGGPVVRRALEAGGGELIPVDSEHSALYQCLVGEELDRVSRLILTASGGPFRGWERDRLAHVTPVQALAHPTWDMGPRITVDSATMFNKGLEIIEAHHLFGIPYDDIVVVVHPQSILHSAVEFVDGSWKGQFGHPDMRHPIQYALTSPERFGGEAQRFELSGHTLIFEELDPVAFPAVDLARTAGRSGGSAPAVLNAADEVAVEAFLQRRLGFLGITEVVAGALDTVPWRPVETVEDVLAADTEARATAAGLIAGVC